MAETTIRWRIESLFERWGHWVVRRPIPVLAIMLAVSVLCIANMRNLELDTSIEGFLLKDDPILLTYNKFRDDFGRDNLALIAIRSDEMFSFGFLEKLRAFHEDIEENVVHLDEVTSLINARSTRGAEGELIVEDLFEDWPEDEAALAVIRDRALINPIYRNLLLSEDGTYTVIAVRFSTYSPSEDAELLGFESDVRQGSDDSGQQTFLTGDELLDAMGSLRDVMGRHEDPDFQFYLAGGPVLVERIAHSVRADMMRFISLAMLAAAAILFMLFRRISASLLAIGIVMLSLLTTMGIAPLLGIAIQIPTQILPTFLLAVGVGDSVHILAIFYQRLSAGDSKSEAIASALRHSGLAVLMTSLTTAGALLSFAFAELLPIRNLGFLAPLGVMLAMVYTLTILPAMLSLLPIKETGRGNARLAIVDRILMGCAKISIERPRTVVGVAVVILAVSLFGAAQLNFSNNVLNFFPKGDPLRTSMDLLGDELGGAVTIEVLFESAQENRLHDPALLAKIEALHKRNETLNYDGIFIGKSLSIVDVIKEINQALNENRPEYRRIPDNRQLIAQELLLFENSGADDLADFSDSLFSTGRMTLRLPWADSLLLAPLVRQIEHEYTELMGADAKVTVTGLTALLSRTFEAVVASTASSYIIAFVVITPLMMMVLASVKLGALSMFPNILPIVITLAIMGIFDFPLDTFTLLIGSIALGLVVDDTIHFMHGFQRHYAKSRDSAEAVRSTLATSGQAMLVTTIVLSSGFLVFTAGYMDSTFNLGFLTATALALGFLGDALLAPALVVLMTRQSTPSPVDQEPGIAVQG